MSQVSIREVELLDIELLRDLSIKTFVDTFSAYNTEQNMNNYIYTAFALEKLKQELQEPTSRFYFIYVDSVLAGYLKLNQGTSQTEMKMESSLEIERIYILSTFQGKGIGQLLFEKALAIGRQRGVDFVWLGVWEKNHRAIEFYQKNGFEPFDTHVFMLGDDKQLDIMMIFKSNNLLFSFSISIV